MTSEKQISPTRLAFKLQIQILSGPNKAAKMKKKIIDVKTKKSVSVLTAKCRK